MIGCGTGIITVILDPKGDIYPCMNNYNPKFKICNVFDKNLEEKFGKGDFLQNNFRKSENTDAENYSQLPSFS